MEKESDGFESLLEGKGSDSSWEAGASISWQGVESLLELPASLLPRLLECRRFQVDEPRR